MPAAAAVCYILSSTFFLALALEHCGLDPHCPADTTAVTMISVQHDPADGSLSLLSTTPRPVLREGELLVKVTIKMARASGRSLVHGTFVREASSSCSLLQVKAAGVNRLDLLQAAGRYPPPPGDSQILGVEGKCVQPSEIVRLFTVGAH